MSQDSQKYEQVNPKQARSGWETEHTLGGPVATFGVDRAAVGVRLVRRRRGDLLLPGGRLLPASRRAPKVKKHHHHDQNKQACPRAENALRRVAGVSLRVAQADRRQVVIVVLQLLDRAGLWPNSVFENASNAVRKRSKRSSRAHRAVHEVHAAPTLGEGAAVGDADPLRRHPAQHLHIAALRYAVDEAPRHVGRDAATQQALGIRFSASRRVSAGTRALG